MAKNKLKAFAPVLFFWIATNALIKIADKWFDKWNMDQNVLFVGNLLLCVITLISFLLAQKGLKNPNPYAFVRSVYMSVMLKLFVCIIAAFVYISMYKSNLNKPALFTCMGLYLVYTFMEVGVLMKLLKQKKNA